MMISHIVQTILFLSLSQLGYCDRSRGEQQMDQSGEWLRASASVNTKDRNVFIEQSLLGKCTNLDQIYMSHECISNLYKCVNNNATDNYLNILVTGGAGFVGSHLVDSLMLDGHNVTVWDDLSTGRKSNIEHWIGHDNFKLIELDVASRVDMPSKIYDQIYHLAAPASPVHYMLSPIKTINTIVSGTMNLLELSHRQVRPARIVLASTSEIYGDPLVHPQTEDYWGNTNSIGPRSCYDEGKRLTESLSFAYIRQHNSSIAIARIFNTYGPRMHPNDGRVISNFVTQAIQSKPITVYGTGNQTRSFQYVSDLISGLRALMASSISGPINLGNPQEIAIATLATRVKHVVPKTTSRLEFCRLPVDDPSRRRPDIGKALLGLDWKPQVELLEGLKKTVEYFSQELAY